MTEAERERLRERLQLPSRRREPWCSNCSSRHRRGEPCAGSGCVACGERATRLVPMRVVDVDTDLQTGARSVAGDRRFQAPMCDRCGPPALH